VAAVMSVPARLPPELKARLAPLLRILSSDNDGERANASAAIGRLLKNSGRDWHDLTDALLTEPKAPTPERRPQPAQGTWKRSDGPIDLPRQELIDLLDLIEEHSPFLPLKSREFVSSLRSRAWRPMMHLSERQWRWMQDLLQDTGV
jgi:hypothetical protein